MDRAIYANDLIHRYASHTFTETTVGSLTKVEFKDAGSALVKKKTNLLAIDAYRAIRQDLLGDENPVFLSTLTERDALENVDAGTAILNLTDAQDQTYNGTSWVAAGGETGGIVHLAVSTIQTTDNTQTSLNTFSLVEDKAYLFKAEVIAEKTDHSAVAGFVIECTAKRETGGSAVLVGATTIIHSGKDTGASSWSVTFTVSGNNLHVSVTGQNSTTIDWCSSLNYIIF